MRHREHTPRHLFHQSASHSAPLLKPSRSVRAGRRSSDHSVLSMDRGLWARVWRDLVHASIVHSERDVLLGFTVLTHCVGPFSRSGTEDVVVGCLAWFPLSQSNPPVLGVGGLAQRVLPVRTSVRTGYTSLVAHHPYPPMILSSANRGGP